MGPKIPTYSRYRPRILTLVLLLLVVAPTILANLTLERRIDAQSDDSVLLLKETYGWPLIWRWNNFGVGPAAIGPTFSEYSVARLATNLAIWLAIVAGPAVTCEWLLRRHRLRLRWSLRTMLVAVFTIAALCAWIATARKRANVQDALITTMSARRFENVWVKRTGPRWLDFFGLDRFRRHIARAKVCVGYDEEKDHDDLEVLDALLRLPDLHFLDSEALRLSPAIEERLTDMGSPNLQSLHLRIERLTPAIAVGLRRLQRLRMLGVNVEDASPQAIEALADLQQLRALSFSCGRDDEHSKHLTREFLDAACKLTRLESLRLSDLTVNSVSLQRLSGLANLKLLRLVFVSSDEQHLLAHLPPLPRLEVLDLRSSDVGDDDVQQIAAQTSLKALNLAFTDVTSAGVAQLASCKSLEELVIRDDALSLVALQSLMAFRHLRTLHIYGGRPKWELDGGDEDARCWRRAFDALRQSNPGIVIDARSELTIKRDVPEVWHAPSGDWEIGGEFELVR